MNQNRVIILYLASLGIAKMWLSFSASNLSLMTTVSMEGISDQDALLKLTPPELRGKSVGEYIKDYAKQLIFELWPDIEKTTASINGTIEIVPGGEVPIEMTLNVASFVPFKYRLNDSDCLVPYKDVKQEPLVLLLSLPEEEV